MPSITGESNPFFNALNSYSSMGTTSSIDTTSSKTEEAEAAVEGAVEGAGAGVSTEKKNEPTPQQTAVSERIQFRDDVGQADTQRKVLRNEAEVGGENVPPKQRASQSKRIERHSVWNEFNSGVKKLSRLFTDRTITVSAAMISAGILTGANAVILATITRLSAARAAGGAGAAGASLTPSPNMPVDSTKLSRLAHAGYLANGLVLAVSIPVLVFGIADIVTKAKEAVGKGKTLYKASKDRTWVQTQLAALKTEQDIDKRDAVVKRLKKLGHQLNDADAKAVDSQALERALIAADHGLSEEIRNAKGGIVPLSVGIGLKAATLSLASVKSINAVLSIAWIALVKGGGALTATCQNISSVTSVLGPLGAGLGLLLGGIGSVLTGGMAVKTQLEISSKRKELIGVNKSLEHISEVDSGKGLVLTLEKARLGKEISQLKEKRRNVLLNFASTLAMTAAGAAGFALALGLVSGPGALVLAAGAVVLLGVSVGISIGAYLMKKRGAKDLVAELKEFDQPTFSVEIAEIAKKENIETLSDKEVLKFIPGGAKLKGEKRATAIAQFRLHPEPYLSTYFQILKPADPSDEKGTAKKLN